MQNDPNHQINSASVTRNEPSVQIKQIGRGILSLSVILKYLAIFAAVFFTAIIQTGFFLHLRPLGSSPDLCLALCVAVALKWGAKKGAIVGIMSGFCLDAFANAGFSLLIPFYFILSVSVGLIGEGNNAKGFPTFAAVASLSALMRVLLIFFELCLSASSFSASGVFINVILPHFIITTLFSPLLYLAVMAVDKLFGKNDKTTRH